MGKSWGGVVDLAMDPIRALADEAMSRCTTRDWREALRAARSVVIEAGTGIPRGSGSEEQMVVLVALRIIQTWMRQQD